MKCKFCLTGEMVLEGDSFAHIDDPEALDKKNYRCSNGQCEAEVLTTKDDKIIEWTKGKVESCALCNTIVPRGEIVCEECNEEWIDHGGEER